MDRTHILAEIRRTAEANGGKPPGHRKFRDETGISAYDWGKHWPRWGDAVEEAGYQRNRKTTAISEGAMLANLVAYVRELRRFPTWAELRTRHAQNPDFPNEKTWRNRFGSVSDLALHLSEFCQREGFDDIAQICASRVRSPDRTTATTPGDPPVDGSVYLVKYQRYYKIGRTNSVGRRERELAIALPEKTRLVHTIRTDDPVGIERYWHERFTDKRREGEWFQLTADDVKAFRRRKFM